MLPPDYRWEEQSDGMALCLDGVAQYPYRCANWAPKQGGGGVLLHCGVRDCLPNQRVFSSAGIAIKFAESWATKWDAEIRRIVRNKGLGYRVAPITPEVAREAAQRDYKRRHGSRKNWWKESG